MPRALTDPWTLGGITLANRVVLAPLAGIGNWFVRLQAQRHGAGLAVSEMVSSFALHYRNERTLRELMRIHPDEGVVAIQLFGHDPEVMRSAAAHVASRGADLIDLNMGCPVPKVMKTGAGAALLQDADSAVAIARAARATATAVSGCLSRAAPAPVFITLGTGQPMLRSIRSAPASATRAAAERITSGSCPNSWIETGPPSRSRGSITSSSSSVRRFSWWIAKLETISDTAKPAP